MASSSREAAQLEQQNDQRLDELHSKIRSLKGVRGCLFGARSLLSLLQVTSDIYEDVESQRLTLDDMVSIMAQCYCCAGLRSSPGWTDFRALVPLSRRHLNELRVPWASVEASSNGGSLFIVSVVSLVFG